MSIQAVVFDIGDVLEVNPRTGWPDRWAARLGMGLDELEARLGGIWAAGSVGKARLDEVERRIGKALDLDAATVTLLMDDSWAEYLGSLNEELARYFAALRPRYRTGILSNSFVGAREREQAAYGFEDMCDAVVYSHEIGVMKPDARAFQAVCRALSVEPGAVLFLDDVETNVEAARAMGMHAVAFHSNEQAITDVEALLSDRFAP